MVERFPQLVQSVTERVAGSLLVELGPEEGGERIASLEAARQVERRDTRVARAALGRASPRRHAGHSGLRTARGQGCADGTRDERLRSIGVPSRVVLIPGGGWRTGSGRRRDATSVGWNLQVRVAGINQPLPELRPPSYLRGFTMYASTLKPGTARTALPLLLLCALIACSDRVTPVAPIAPESASLKRDAAPAHAELLVTGLEGAFGSTVGPDGAMFVAEWAVGRIARIDPQTGAVTAFASGLPVNLVVGGGVKDLAFIGRTAYALVSLVAPEVGGSDVDGIYRMDGPNSFTIVADIGAFNRANPPETDFFVPTGVLVAMESYRGGFLVTDGHLNRVLYVSRDGEISVFRAFDNIVPTGLDVSGQTVYMAEAGPLPHLPENGKVVAFGAKSTTAIEIASGARLAVDVEFGRGRTLFALSQGVWHGVDAGEPALPNTGALMRVNGDGTLTTIIDGLNRPISLEIIKNTGYVVTLGGEIWVIDDIAGPHLGQ